MSELFLSFNWFYSLIFLYWLGVGGSPQHFVLFKISASLRFEMTRPLPSPFVHKRLYKRSPPVLFLASCTNFIK